MLLVLYSLEGVKKSKQLIRRLTDEGGKKCKGEVLSLLCDLCVLYPSTDG
jgi:hypothetical protein